MVFIFIALAQAVHTVHDLRWPYDLDHWRDLSQVQTTLDGHPLADPHYAGEWIWYNPLVSWIVALGSLVTRADVALVHTRAGPFLTLLGPIMFYLLGRRLIGAAGALTALTLYLFVVCGDQPSYAVATYSPWLFAGNLAQGLFYGSVIALLWTRERSTAFDASSRARAWA